MNHILSTIQIFRRWTIWSIALLSPIVFLPITPEFYQMNKLYVLAAATLILFALWIFESLLSGKMRFVITNSTKGAGILAFAVTVTTLFAAANKMESFITPIGVVLFLTIFLFLLFSQASEDHGAFPSLNVGITAALVILAVITIYHASGILSSLTAMFPFFRDPMWNPSGNTLTALVLFVAGIPLFGQAIGSFAKKRGIDRVTIILPAVGLILVAIAALFIGYTLFIKQPIRIMPISISFQVLTNSWQQTTQAIAGKGLASYSSAFAAGKPIRLNQTLDWNTYPTAATGLFIHMATTTGLVGLVGLAIAWIWPLLVYRKKFSNIKEQWGVLTSYLVLTLILFFLPPTLPFLVLWMFLMLFMEKDQKTKTVTYTLSRHTAIMLFGAVSITVLAASGYLLGRSYMAQMSLFQSLKAVDEKNGTSAYQWANISLAQNPFLATSHVYFSQINLELASALAKKENITEEERNTITSLVGQSIREAKKGITEDPTNPMFWTNLARIYEALIPITQGSDQWAIASYQQAAIYDPTNPLLRFALGSISVTRKDYDGALNYFGQAVALKQDFVNAYYNLAYVYKLKGDATNEIAMLKKTLSFLNKENSDYPKVADQLQELTRQQEASKAAVQKSESAAGQPPLTTPPSGNPIIIPPLNLPQDK